MSATEQQKRWAFGAGTTNDTPCPSVTQKHVKVIHSKGGYLWRLVGYLGEEYRRGWARKSELAHKAGMDAKAQADETEQKEINKRNNTQ